MEKINLKTKIINPKTTKIIGNILGTTLYALTLLDLFLINNTNLLGALIIITSFLCLHLSCKYLKGNKKIIYAKQVCLILSIVCQFIYILRDIYFCYVLSNILTIGVSLGIFVIFNSILDKSHINKKSIVIAKRMGILFIGIIVIPITIFLVVTTITPKPLIMFAQKNVFSACNSYNPINESNKVVLSNSHLYMNDISYGSEYPNSYLDIYISDNDTKNIKPTFVMIHGGGFVWGDKAEGDPNGDSSGSIDYITSLLDAGYNVVSVNYALAPEYLYPTPIKQISQAIRFLQEEGVNYGIYMSQVIFGGDSAGGHLEGQFVNIQTNSEYAKEIGIEPVMNKENIIAVIFNSALLDIERFGDTGNPIMDYLFLQCGRAYFNCGFLEGNKSVIQSNVIDNIISDFPPTYISDGNSGTFDSQAKELYSKMNDMGIKNYFNYHEKSEVVLFHGYESDGSIWAQDNMKKQLEFLLALMN